MKSWASRGRTWFALRIVFPADGGPAMMMTKEGELLKAREGFQALVAFVNHGGVAGLRLDQVERELWRQLLAIGLALLRAFVASVGDSDARPTIERDGQTLRRLSRRR